MSREGQYSALCFSRAPPHRKIVKPALSQEVEQGCNPPQGQMDCKVEAHVYSEHDFSLLSTGMTPLLTQGGVAFVNPVLPLLNQSHIVKPHCGWLCYADLAAMIHGRIRLHLCPFGHWGNTSLAWGHGGLC